MITRLRIKLRLKNRAITAAVKLPCWLRGGHSWDYEVDGLAPVMRRRGHRMEIKAACTRCGMREWR